MTHNVYVIELSSAVLKKPAFREANPEHDPRKPCVYVGLTGRTPEIRFQQHREGIKAARYVKLFGVRLRPQLYARFNPMPYDDAVKMEREIARRLRKRGYAVWQK